MRTLEMTIYKRNGSELHTDDGGASWTRRYTIQSLLWVLKRIVNKLKACYK